MCLNNEMLSRIIIKGFKSIKQCDIKFGKTNVLIGCNGAGKSNFISAFSLLQDILLKNLQLSSVEEMEQYKKKYNVSD